MMTKVDIGISIVLTAVCGKFHLEKIENHPNVLRRAEIFIQIQIATHL